MGEVINPENTSRFLEETTEKIGCEIKQYINAQKAIVKTAEAEIRKATTFEEKQYWMEKMEKSKNEERQDIIIAVSIVAGVILVLGAIAIIKKR